MGSSPSFMSSTGGSSVVPSAPTKTGSSNSSTPNFLTNTATLKAIAAKGGTTPPSTSQTEGDNKSSTQLPDNGKSEIALKNEFQEFVAQSAGTMLPMYGYNLFRTAPDTFEPVTHIPVTPDYTIGPGDELLIRLWGQIELSQNAVVDRNGMIDLPKVGPISVVGVRYQNLQAHLKTAMSRVFRNFQLDVSLGKLRSIQIIVVGHAARPGSYTISSMSTLVNALFASGGPSGNGSMRHIQLKRKGKTITEFDLYDLLLKGDQSKDVQLLSGDVIYIPTIGPMVAIIGSITSPAIYELGGNESLMNLLSLAGGLTNVAARQKVTVERIHERKMRKVEEFALNKDGLARTMQDGDLVRVYGISSRFDNAVTLRGNIATPGRHPWHEGLRISDVIPDKTVLIIDSYWLKQNQASRTGIANSGSLRNDVKHNLAEVNWDYAVIERLNNDNLTTNLIPFNLGQAVINREPAQNHILQSGDTITIFSKDDIQVPAAQRTKYITLEGELAHPGVYQAIAGETLRELVTRVGGLSSQAYLFGSEFNRESMRQEQQKRLDEITSRMGDAMQRNAMQSSANALSKDDVDSSKLQLQAQQGLLDKMRQVKATGRIVLDVQERTADLSSLPNLTLEDGDHLYIPITPSTVSVMGVVYNQNSFIYKENQTIRDYLSKAGGSTVDGDKSSVYLVRADGVVFSKQQHGSFFGGGFDNRQASPGDTIVVPELLERYKLTKELKDWTQIFYQFSIGIASLKILGLFSK